MRGGVTWGDVAGVPSARLGHDEVGDAVGVTRGGRRPRQADLADSVEPGDHLGQVVRAFPFPSRVPEPIVRLAGLAITLAYAALIAWVVVNQPQRVTEVGGFVSSSIGAYRVDQQAFEEGLRFFHADQFREARLALDRADPARRDALTQFYVAYTFYREGWGRFYHDDELYKAGLDAVTRAASLAPSGQVAVDDPRLGMRTSDELAAELERGLARELSDANPMRIFGTRR